MRSLWMAAGALAVAGLGALPAEAQWGVFGGRDDRARRQARDPYGRSNPAYRYGYERGFGDGIDHGAKDGDHRHDFNFAHSKDYRKGDRGYRSSYGPKYDYIAGYRAGYEEGYTVGYDQPGHGRGRASVHRRDRPYEGRDGYYDDRGRFHPYGDGGYYDRDGRYHPGDGRWDDEDQQP